MADQQSRRIKVAVVGGGCASLAAAFELTRPEHLGKYQVTVCQMGWRLGGKGASGRSGEHRRIEEHGLHVWLGFYENAFRLLRECYAELEDREKNPAKYSLSQQPQFARSYKKWTEAFFADPYVGVAEKMASGTIRSWTAHFAPIEGLPGDPIDEHDNPFSLPSYLARCVGLLRTLLLSVLKEHEPAPGPGRRRRTAGEHEVPPLEFARLSARTIVARITRMLRVGMLTTAAGLLEATALLEMVVRERVSLPEGDYVVLQFVEAITENVRRQLEDLVAIDQEIRVKLEIVDLVLAIVVGVIRDGLLTEPRGLDAIDHLDCREWLRRNGASERACNCAFVRGLYNMAFAHGPRSQDGGGIAAGQALRGALRMFFTYRGSLFWKMRGSMGDVVFAPLYQLLRSRGVRFEFFHRLEKVTINRQGSERGEAPYVEALEFDRQAIVSAAGGEYRPLDAKGCWPASPDYAQLAQPSASEARQFECYWDRRRIGVRTLKVVDDFDFVVLGVSIDAVREVCKEIADNDERWRAMLANVRTVATQSFQIWLRKELSALGWSEPSITLSAYEGPFDTWSDMTHVVAEESWPDAARPRALAYFCGALPDTQDPAPRPAAEHYDAMYPQQRREEVRRNMVTFLNRHLVGLWPGAAGKRGRFDWTLLVDAQFPDSQPATMQRAFAAQYWTANVNPTERYVLSRPRSLEYRISPLDNTYDNLTIAGDWTDCGFNEGCAEAAFMSGRLAAHAISLQPPLEDIVGYDHP